MTFLVEMGFWAKSLVARYYEITWVGGYLVGGVSFCGVSKHIGILIVRLKTIEYKKDSFCYLFFSRLWPSGCIPSDPILPAVCLQNFCILGGTHLFTQAFSNPRSVLQSEPLFAELLADPQKGQLLLQRVG